MTLNEEDKQKAYKEIIWACSIQNGKLDTKKDQQKKLTILKKYYSKENPLLDINKSIKLENDTDWTPLIIATYFNKIEEIKLLFELGANKNNCETKEGFNPLHLAATNNKVALCKIFKNNGFLIDSVTKKLQTPLMLASDSDSMDAVEFLLENNANALLKDIEGDTCLDYCKKKENMNLFKFIQFRTLTNGIEIINKGKKAGKI